MTTNIYQQLSEPFPQGMEKRLNKGGANLIYIPVSEVINRMNKVLGENWDKIDGPWQQVGNSIVAQVTVIVRIDGITVRRDGVGGQKIKLTKQGEPVDIGDEVKGAYSDAFKKAVQTLGIGLYLARSDEAIEIEQMIDATQEMEVAQKSEPTAWDNFMSISKALNKSQKEELRASWVAHTDGRPTPTKDTATEQDIEFLSTEAARIAFGGSYVETSDK
jgi:hypothetical protein